MMKQIFSVTVNGVRNDQKLGNFATWQNMSRTLKLFIPFDQIFALWGTFLRTSY